MDSAVGADAAPAPARSLPFERLAGRDGKEADSCLFYWLDAHEEPYKNPGQVFLFGKVMANERAVTEALRHNAHVDRLARDAADKAAAKKAAAEVAAAAATEDAPKAPAEEDDDDDMMAGAKLPAKLPVPAPEMASCCLTVSGNLRCVFVLPRMSTAGGEAVELKDVWAELRDGAMRDVIPQGKGNFAVKKASRNYAFELAGIPREATDYLKLKYSATFAALPSTLTGDTFSHVFGTSTSVMETFLIKRKLAGPCWLRLSGVRNTASPVSHCAYDLSVEDPKGVTVYGEPTRVREAPAERGREREGQHVHAEVRASEAHGLRVRRDLGVGRARARRARALHLVHRGDAERAAAAARLLERLAHGAVQQRLAAVEVPAGRAVGAGRVEALADREQLAARVDHQRAAADVHVAEGRRRVGRVGPLPALQHERALVRRPVVRREAAARQRRQQLGALPRQREPHAAVRVLARDQLRDLRVEVVGGGRELRRPRRAEIAVRVAKRDQRLWGGRVGHLSKVMPRPCKRQVPAPNQSVSFPASNLLQVRKHEHSSRSSLEQLREGVKYNGAKTINVGL
jgi:hypothetical protein